MTTLGFRQPFWVDADGRTVMTWTTEGEAAAQWEAPSLHEALEYCAAANAEFQINTYGQPDPRSTLRHTAATWGMGTNAAVDGGGLLKEGDELVCVNAEPKMKLTVGKRYVVQWNRRPDINFPTVINDDGRPTMYNPRWFELAEPATPQGEH